MKITRGYLVAFLAVNISLVLAFNKGVALAKKENYCFTCHTSARKLIQITREISKTNKEKPGGSPETKGEG